MRHKGLYFIVPNQDLLVATESMEEGIKFAFTSEMVISGNESDRSSWSEEDYIARAKLSFLMELKSEYSDAPEYNLLFGDHKLSIDLFDKWWKVKRFEISIDIDEIDCIDESEIAFTGNEKVDDWLKGRTI